MGVPLEFVNKARLQYTVILLNVNVSVISWFLYEDATIGTACERFMCVSLQCLNKTLLCCDNLPTNYTCPPFSCLVSVVLHFQVLHFHVFHLFWSLIFRSCIFSPPVLSIIRRYTNNQITLRAKVKVKVTG